MEKNVGDIAVKYFSEGFSCAEAVLMSIAESQGLSSPLIPKVATAFGSGLACTNGMCGALSGGILALSLMKGRSTKEDSKHELYSDVSALNASFEKQFGSIECTSLLGFSLTEADAGTKFAQGDCFKTKCIHYVTYAAENTIEKL